MDYDNCAMGYDNRVDESHMEWGAVLRSGVPWSQAKKQVRATLLPLYLLEEAFH